LYQFAPLHSLPETCGWTDFYLLELNEKEMIFFGAINPSCVREEKDFSKEKLQNASEEAVADWECIVEQAEKRTFFFLLLFHSA